MEDNSQNQAEETAKKLLTGAAVGAAVAGAAAALSNPDIRDGIKKTAQRAGETARDVGEKVAERAQEMAEQAPATIAQLRDEFDKLIKDLEQSPLSNRNLQSEAKALQGELDNRFQQAREKGEDVGEDVRERIAMGVSQLRMLLKKAGGDVNR